MLQESTQQLAAIWTGLNQSFGQISKTYQKPIKEANSTYKFSIMNVLFISNINKTAT